MEVASRSLKLHHLIFSLLLGAIPFFSHSEEISAHGFLTPFQDSRINPPITGTIESIAVTEGQFVKKGQPLIVLKTNELKAEYEVAVARANSEGRIKAADSARILQQQRVDGKRRLLGKSVNRVELDNDVAELQIREAELLTAREDRNIAALEARRIRTQIEERAILAPIDGYIDDITKQVGETIGSGQMNDPDSPRYVIRVSDLTRLKISVFFPYQHVRDLKKGDTLKVVSIDKNLDWEALATVDLVSKKVNAATDTTEVKVIIDNSEQKYTSGLKAKVILRSE